jgi:hypothetical protein
MRRWLLLAFFAASAPALAHHPGDRLDEVIGAKEPAFETADGAPPAIKLRAIGDPDYALDDLDDKIIVLSFVPDGCGTPCADQQVLLAEVHEALEITPMRDMVSFVTVVPPESVAAPGKEDANWLAATPQDRTTVAEMRASWAELSLRGGDVPMAYVLPPGASHAAIFHGAGFARINMVLYINGLTNAPPPEPGPLDWFWGLFR